MYEIKPETIKTFITDRNIKLPRFQRKQTWDDKKNFELCISVFKKYPIGVSILSVDVVKGKTIRWLLDGRQRRNALTLMYEDPEQIYFWAKKFIGFKNSDQPADIAENFWKKVNEYIDADGNDDVQEGIECLSTDTDESEDLTESVEIDDDADVSTNGLDLLLEIIKMIHNKSSKYTGFTRPFNMIKYVEKLPYYVNNNGNAVISSKLVKLFIDDYRKYCDFNDIDYDQQSSFLSFLNERYTITDKNNLKKNIALEWENILERIQMLDKIDALLSDGNIGLIIARDLKPSDSQKIFNIINSKGEKLTAVEVLSAKPSWNIRIENPTEEMKECVKTLYSRIGTVNNDIVRWDLPATLVDRWGKNYIIKKFDVSKNTDFQKKLTTGFKILSGIYEGGVKKDNIDELSKNSNINWAIDYENIISDLKQLTRVISTHTYFKFFNTWQISLMELTSDAVALNFIIIAYMDWKRKGKPIGTDNRTRQFQKNCFILLDKLLYEYVLRQWHGASDQKIANNIVEFNNLPDIFNPVSGEKWSALFNEIFTRNTINDVNISKDYMTALLYHFYCLKKIAGPDTLYTIEVDHIIPQDYFKNSTIVNRDIIKDNILNLGCLPKEDNIAKGKHRLIEVSDEWLINQIEKYEFIKKEKFQFYSDIGNVYSIYKERQKLFYDAYSVDRENLLNSQG